MRLIIFTVKIIVLDPFNTIENEVKYNEQGKLLQKMVNYTIQQIVLVQSGLKKRIKFGLIHQKKLFKHIKLPKKITLKKLPIDGVDKSQKNVIKQCTIG